MLTVDDAKRIAADWRPRFHDELDFDKSWERYFETATVPDEARLVPWLAHDLERAELKYMGVPREPLVPTPSRFAASGCTTCTGKRYVRLDVDIDDSRFGKALACPDCNGGRRSDLLTQPREPLPARRDGNWCWNCGAAELDPAGARCSNPTWHTPHGMPQADATVATVLKRF